jgi:hypothetical protein
MEKYNLTGTCQVIRSADYALKHFAHDIVATSDTVIIEKAACPVVDLPRMILEEKYQADFTRLADLIGLSVPD